MPHNGNEFHELTTQDIFTERHKLIGEYKEAHTKEAKCINVYNWAVYTRAPEEKIRSCISSMDMAHMNRYRI
jgi:hypothetical protein